MNDYLGIIEKINKECRILFEEDFRLIPSAGHHNTSIFRIEGRSFALNRYDEDPVKVIKWFEKFWLYMEVKFIVERSKKGNKQIENTHVRISLSIYEGDDADDRKMQLFRAEWDDNNNPIEKHAQPHWHITSGQAIERTFEEYSNHLDDGDFISLLLDYKSQLFDVEKIHFAMNGNWQVRQMHIHEIKCADQVAEWLKGLLSHIRIELVG